MLSFRCKIGKDGRIIIPSSFRKLMKVSIGDEMIMTLSEDKLNVVNAKKSLKDFQYKIQALTKGASLVDGLIQMRREDNQHDE